MHRLFAVVLVISAACGSRHRTTSDAPAANQGSAAPATATPAMPTEPAEAQPILDELNDWCRGTDDCAVAEMPDAFPDRVSSGETNGWIASHREQLGRYGVDVVWDASARRFVSRIEADLRLMIGGNFSPDHIGPDRYAAVLARAHARAALYLGVLVERVAPSTPGASHVAELIELLRPDAPDEAATATERLAGMIER